MKRLILAAALVLCLAVTAWAQGLDRGYRAWNGGDYETALREWRPLAEQGDAEAQNNLGAMYNNGQGVTQDYAEAVRW